MNRYGILPLFAILLIGGSVYNAFGQSDSISDNVVINEIDINPPGDDSQSISEWVELYNPTDSPIDIGGWEIASTTILKKTLIVPVGTTIDAGKYKTFSYEKLWFPDVGELVQLRDDGGLIIDQTPTIDDLENDFTSWQRIYDGYDTDSKSDWKFNTSTAGFTNGQLTVSKETDLVTVTLETDKTKYLFGETATISGSVSEEVFIEKPFFQSEQITIIIDGPNYYKPVTLYPDRDLNFETTLGLQQVYGIYEGIYDVSVTYAEASERVQFSVGNEIIEIEEEEESTLSISAEQTSYIPGQTAIISAQTSEIIPFEGLKFKVSDPNGIQVFDGTLYPDTDGKFSTTIYMTTVNPVYGTYDITAEYASQSAKSSFNVFEEFIEDKPISLFTDKPVYGLGETVEITGRLNNLWIFSMDLTIQQVGTGSLDTSPLDLVKELDSVRLEGDSTFRHEFKISNNPDRLGEYRVTVSKDVGSAEIFFKVVEDPSTYQGGDDVPFTVYSDKTSYETGDLFTISGKVNQITSSSSFYTPTVDIEIKSVDGDFVQSSTNPSSKNKTPIRYTLTSVPDIGGNYKIEERLYKAIFDPGDYLIEASYADGTYKASSSFTIVDPFDIESDFQLDINKEVFGLNEEVIVDGLIPGLPQGSGVTITLYKPDGDTDEFGSLADNSEFSWAWKTPIAEKTQTVFNDRNVVASNYGVYQVIFSTDSGSANVFFKVSPNPTTDSLSVLPIEVSTDKPIYNAGETLTVSGVAQKRVQGTEGLVVEERAKIIVNDSVFPYDEIYDAFVYLDNGGRFESSFTLPITLFKEGTYKVTAIYDNNRADTVFTVDNEFVLGGDEDLSLIIDSDKDEYSIGEVAQITGRVSKLVYLDKVDVTVVKEDLAQITCGSFVCGTAGTVETVVPSASGSFTYDYNIPADSSAIGKYEVMAATEFGTYHLEFDVTDKIAAPESTTESIQRVTEKFNRISDSIIPISAAPKSQDGDELHPRVIQGSLFTTARGDESSVNLKVVADNGVCVIGPMSECLVSESTRVPGAIYKVVEIDGINYNVRYSGTDVRLEKFTIIPESSEVTIPESMWNVEVLKDEQVSRFYYKITHIAAE